MVGGLTLEFLKSRCDFFGNRHGVDPLGDHDMDWGYGDNLQWIALRINEIRSEKTAKAFSFELVYPLVNLQKAIENGHY